ncbi:MAG: diaminopimelate decarboxylase [Anaerolineae bacterium]|nr:diaminopimelate decarboxylase [Anaerolineae bacterium]
MTLSESIHYRAGSLHCDDVPIRQIVAHVGTPVYIYSLRRVLANLARIRRAFASLNPHIHYSAKANANITILTALVNARAGIDAVSAGEIHRALLAGAEPNDIVFAGVGKTPNEIGYALEHNVGWINVENEGELVFINEMAQSLNFPPVRIALRLNPDIGADTHPYIATGHGGAKFGLPVETIRSILARQGQLKGVSIEGIHVHIGSQLHNTAATQQAVQKALDLIAPYERIRTVNIGGGLPVAYHDGESIPAWEDFAAALTPLLRGYSVILEPGRSVIADAGILVASVIYVKEQAGKRFLITDASMSELIRPALYQARHQIIPVTQQSGGELPYEIVGPVCETTDVLGHDIRLPATAPGELLAVLTTGAYGMVMASNYNQRVRPPEVIVLENGEQWTIARRRETWEDLVRLEQ